nr:MAG TPA: hypothetical protein [Caudoviricetes sp.]
MNNILEICQEVADIVATQRPTDLFDANSQQAQIYLSVAKSTLDSLMRYGDWQDLTKEATLVTNNTQTVYPISDIAPDFYSILNNTVYIKDDSEKVIGSITAEQWMRDKYFNCPTINTKFKIQNNCIKFLEPVGCSYHIVFQYRSNATCFDCKSLEEKETITKNTDIPIFDRYLVKLGIMWRFLKRNGMDYSEEYNEYQRELKKRFGAGLATKDINLAHTDIMALGVVNVKPASK